MDTMNGLKTIRRQCNFSLTELAEQLGVTRQAMSAWENGKKQIPQSRKMQIAEFFGIEEIYLDEITEEQRQELIKKPMYKFCIGISDKYRYKGTCSTDEAIYLSERSISVDQELEDALRQFKRLESRLVKLKLNRGSISEELWILFINRNYEAISMLTDIIESLNLTDEHELSRSYDKIMSVLSELKNEMLLGGNL